MKGTYKETEILVEGVPIGIVFETRYGFGWETKHAIKRNFITFNEAKDSLRKYFQQAMANDFERERI